MTCFVTHTSVCPHPPLLYFIPILPIFLPVSHISSLCSKPVYSLPVVIFFTFVILNKTHEKTKAAMLSASQYILTLFVTFSPQVHLF